MSDGAAVQSISCLGIDSAVGSVASAYVDGERTVHIGETEERYAERSAAVTNYHQCAREEKPLEDPSVGELAVATRRARGGARR